MSKLKPFKFITQLAKKAPKLAGKAGLLVADVATGGKASDIISSLKGEISSSTELSEEDKEIILAQMEDEMEAYDLMLKDVENARQMEKHRMEFGRNFVQRNFQWMLASIIILAAFGIVIALIEKRGNIDANTVTLVNVAFGSIWAAFTTVVGYFFGRSKKEDER